MVFPFDDRANPVPDDLVLKAQQGDHETREYLIRQYQPYVLKITSRYCHRFVKEGIDDEISVATLAFNEAIDGFKPGQGSRFLSFARLVVERRLTDYFRRNKAWFNEIPFSDYGTEEQDGVSTLSALEHQAAEKAFSDWHSARDRREEIIYYTGVLGAYGITLQELVKISPKQVTARKRAQEAARAVADNIKWRNHFLKYKELPLKELDGMLTFSRKTLERHRKYIVAMALVFIEDLPHIREYLKGDDGR
ncbi:MAG: RNA polymerase sigma-I factor [Dethiobacter sp.]|nr:RNA polymerase sigma-I factor [Dethiobacter sp.]